MSKDQTSQIQIGSRHHLQFYHHQLRHTYKSRGGYGKVGLKLHRWVPSQKTYKAQWIVPLPCVGCGEVVQSSSPPPHPQD